MWRDGPRVRIEEADGSVSLIADGTTCWQFERGQDVPVATPQRNLRFGGGTELLARRTAEAIAGDDFTRERTGAFEASLDDARLGLLARRPRSDETWNLGWSAPAHRWSTARWDWTLGFPDARPTPEGIQALMHQLSSGDG